MGRFGWIALTIAALGGGVILNSEDFRDEVIHAEERVDDKIAIAESRIAEIEARIEGRTSSAEEEATDDAGDDAATADEETSAEIDEALEERVEDLKAELDRLREDGRLTDAQYETMIAQLSATEDPAEPDAAAE